MVNEKDQAMYDVAYTVTVTAEVKAGEDTKFSESIPKTLTIKTPSTPSRFPWRERNRCPPT